MRIIDPRDTIHRKLDEAERHIQANNVRRADLFLEEACRLYTSLVRFDEAIEDRLSVIAIAYGRLEYRT
ncbi:MAG TPA: hypothetical protein VJI15_02220 [Candidatus Nanoarchaeia archaeon]|nr:hypothetical protein [Candidatus Nanoarchaeia archaeon]